MEEDRRQKRFVAMYVGVERSVHQLLRTLVHDQRLFEDISQAVALRLWEAFDTYDSSWPFAAWARGVAAKVVLEWKRSDRRFGRLMEPDAVQALVDGFNRHLWNSIELADQLEALEACLDNLPRHSRELIVKRYLDELPVDEVARQVDRPLPATYKALQRVVRQLGECVRQRLSPLIAAEET